jgi:Na+/melibiose symporter-like transporter
MVFMRENCAAQILALLVTSLIFQILIIITNPINDRWDKRITMLIEVSVSIYLYALLSLTDFIGENTLREEIGWLLAILTWTIVVINVIVFLCKCIRRAIMFIKPRLQAWCFK